MRLVPASFFKHLVCAASALFLQFGASAQLLVVSNLDKTSSDGYGTVGSEKWLAQGFQTPGTSYTLYDIGLKLARGNTFNGTFDVSLWDATGASGLPGSLVATVSAGNEVGSLSTTLADYRFASAGSVSLAPSTSYYVVLSGSNPSASAGMFWAFTEAKNPGSTGPGAITEWTRTFDQGASWDADTFGIGNPFQMEITAVPEPALYAFFSGLALMAFGIGRRAKTHSANPVS